MTVASAAPASGSSGNAGRCQDVGVAMRYKSDGTGDMAHSAIIVCYDGTSRLPKIVRRYEDVDAPK